MTPIPSDTSPETHNAVVSPVSFTRAELGAVGLLVASLVGMFWKAIFTPALFFYRDICNYTYPSTFLIRELCRQGSLPYWNPYLNCGQPVLANPNLLFFYPSTLLILLLPFDLAYTLHYILHFALAGIGTYLLARVWGQSYRAAFFAAFVFVFSGQVLSLGNFYNTVACCAWIPWALLVTDRALESKGLRLWILLVVVFSLQWLAAEPLTMMATFGLSFAYAFYRCGAPDRLWSKPNFRVLAIFFLIGGGMLLLCAVQFLPAADMLKNSHRSVGLSFKEITMWSVSPLSFLEILTPNFSGSLLAGPPAWLWLISDQNDPYNLSNFLGFRADLLCAGGLGDGRRPPPQFCCGRGGNSPAAFLRSLHSGLRPGPLTPAAAGIRTLSHKAAGARHVPRGDSRRVGVRCLALRGSPLEGSPETPDLAALSFLGLHGPGSGRSVARARSHYVACSVGSSTTSRKPLMTST